MIMYLQIEDIQEISFLILEYGDTRLPNKIRCILFCGEERIEDKNGERKLHIFKQMTTLAFIVIPFILKALKLPYEPFTWLFACQLVNIRY